MQSNQRFMAHFLSCDLILLVIVKVAFDLVESLDHPLNLPSAFVGISIREFCSE